MGEFAIVDKRCKSYAKSVYTFFRELLDIRKKHTSEVPEVFLGFYGHGYSVEDLQGGHLILWGYGVILDEGLQGLSFCTLKHHL